MKHAFFKKQRDADKAIKMINKTLGINAGTFGFPRGYVKIYGKVTEIDGRWGFPVGSEGPAKADHLVDTEDYEPEEDDGES